MKAVSKMILGAAVMALELASLTGCIVREVVEEIEETTQEKYISKSGNSQSGTLCIQIINNAEGTVLMTDSIEVCNIWIRNSVTGVLQKGSATINLNSQAQTTSATIQLPPQTLTPWSPTTAPNNTSGTYIKIHGTLYTYLTNGELLPLSQGPIYTPIQGTITSANTTTITIYIHPNSPLYCITNGKLEPVLQPINFDATVEEWH